MLDYDAWGANASPIREARRAKDAWKRINRRPTVILIARGEDDLPDQTVRIEMNITSSGTPEVPGDSGASGKLTATLFGVKGHPNADILDTDIQREDRFAVGQQWYRVVDVIQEVGEVQALCEVLA